MVTAMLTIPFQVPQFPASYGKYDTSLCTTLYPDHCSSLTDFVLSVAAELGDYDPRRHSPGYVSEFRFVANQTAELETKISEHHKELQ